MIWAEQEARRRGLRDEQYARYYEAERKAQEAMQRIDEQVAQWGRKAVQAQKGRWRL